MDDKAFEGPSKDSADVDYDGGQLGDVPVLQNFNLPYPIMRYIAMNPPSVEAYQKMVTVCKYFYKLNPILVAESFHNGKLRQYRFADVAKNGDVVNVDLGTKSRVWITKEIYLVEGKCEEFDQTPECLAFLSRKLVSHDISRVCIGSDRPIFFEDFACVAKNADTVITDVHMIEADGKNVKLPRILGCLNNVSDFVFHGKPDSFDSETFAEIAHLKNLESLKCFECYSIPPVIDVASISTFIGDHREMKKVFRFVKRDLVGIAALDALIDEILADGQMNCVILYDGVDFYKHKRMEFMTFMTKV